MTVVETSTPNDPVASHDDKSNLSEFCYSKSIYFARYYMKEVALHIMLSSVLCISISTRD